MKSKFKGLIPSIALAVGAAHGPALAHGPLTGVPGTDADGRNICINFFNGASSDRDRVQISVCRRYQDVCAIRAKLPFTGNGQGMSARLTLDGQETRELPMRVDWGWAVTNEVVVPCEWTLRYAGSLSFVKRVGRTIVHSDDNLGEGYAFDLPGL